MHLTGPPSASSHPHRQWVIRKACVWALGLSLVLVSCASQMSLEQAREVTVAVQTASFTPPPRRAHDILTLIQQPSRGRSESSTEFRSKAYAPDPYRASDTRLAAFYLERGKAAQQLGRMVQCLNDFRQALNFARKAKIALHEYLWQLASAESMAGNFKRAGELAAQSARDSGYMGRYAYVVNHYARMGDLESALEWRQEALQRYKQQISGNPRLRASPMTRAGLARMEATILEAQGRFREAEPFHRTQVAMWAESAESMPSFYLYFQMSLVANLTSQGRLLEAELAARKALEDSLAFGGRQSYFTAWVCDLLGKILIAQNRLEDAEALLQTAIKIFTESGLSANSYHIGRIHLTLVGLFALQEDYASAAVHFDLAVGCMEENTYLHNLLLFRPQVLAALIMAGRETEALSYIDNAYKELFARIGSETRRTALMNSLRALALTRLGRADEALAAYTEALPFLQVIANADDDTEDNHGWTARIALEGYLDLVADRPLPPELAGEAFRIAETLRSQSLQTAIAARSARAAVTDDELRRLTRQEQDAAHQIAVLETNLTEQAAALPDQRDEALARRLATQIQQLQAARKAIRNEIQTRFPQYAEHTRPRPLSLPETQNLLNPGEGLLAVYTTASHTLVWGISPQGGPLIHVAAVGRADLDQAVHRLRAALDCRPQTLGAIPDFDLQTAYQLYQQLFEPVATTWQGARELVVIASTPLSRIPIGILPVAPPPPTAPNAGLLFDHYRTVDWLVRHLAVSHQTSAAAFAALRRSPAASPGRKAFAGFGDPIFQAHRSEPTTTTASNAQGLHVRDQEAALQVRGVRLTDLGTLDDANMASIHLTDLMPLPDTADEIQSIAKAVGANPADSVFLRAQATEGRVKTMALEDRRVIAFATHALVPGDLDGLEEPALALSSAAASGEAEDGLLTMGEIMKLRLDADWVVLSACNTGAGQGAGAEAVSGLGRAFFYAGSRALLVSMWPVETTAARKLTTGIFTCQQADPGLGRARALQQSILALMDGPGYTDPLSGQPAASFAHPLFWAPFIVYGEGAGNQAILPP